MSSDWLAERFEEHRAHLRAVAYRMLGSVSEADDAVQEAWLRLNRADTSSVENLGGWLTPVVARVCLDMLRSRTVATRGVARRAGTGATGYWREMESIPSRKRCWPTRSAWRCWSCWRGWIQPSGWRSSCTTCLPSPSTRSRRSWGGRRPRRGSSPAGPAAACTGRVGGNVRVGEPRRRAERESRRRATPTSFSNELSSTPSWPPRGWVIFRACWRSSIRTSSCAPTARAHRGRFAARRSTPAGRPRAARGRRAAQPALVNGAVGVIVAPRGRLMMVLEFTIENGKIAAVDAIADPERLAELELAVLDG